MFVTPAYAQAAGSAPGGGELIGMLLPIAMIMVVFYFLLFRPQQKKMKEHQEMVSKISRGDTVVTSGGLIGKVTKVTDEKELQVEVGENVKVRVLRQAISEVRIKGEPAKAESKAESK